MAVDVASLPLPTAEEWAEYERKWAGIGAYGVGRYKNERLLFYHRRKGYDPEKLQVHGSYRFYRKLEFCEAIARSTGRKCGCVALPGKTKCSRHDPSVAHKKRAGRAGRPKNAVGFYDNTYPIVYEKYLSDSLKARLAEIAGVDRYDVTKELELTRSTVLDAALIYDAIPGEKALEEKVAAGSILRAAIDGYIETSQKALELEIRRGQNINASTFPMIVKQIVAKAYEAFGEDDGSKEKVRAFADAINTIRLPVFAGEQAQGTMITPDQIVLAMDETIPSGPSNEP